MPPTRRFALQPKRPKNRHWAWSYLGFWYLYGIFVHEGSLMDTISVNKFKDNLKSVVERLAQWQQKT